MNFEEFEEIIGATRTRVIGLLATTMPPSFTPETVLKDIFDEIYSALKVLRMDEEVRQQQQISTRSQTDTIFHEVFRHATDAMVVVDDMGTFVAVNPAAAALFGFTQEALAGKRISDVAQSKPEAEQFWTTFLKLGQQDGVLSILHPDGTLRQLEYTATARIHSSLHLANFRDVTARLAIDAVQQRSVLAHLLSDAVMIAHESMTIESAIQACIELLCTQCGWNIGHAYLVDPDTGTLQSMSTWHLTDINRFTPFQQTTEHLHRTDTLKLPMHVLEAGQPVWLADVTHTPEFARARVAAAVGIRSAVAFPVLVQHRVVAVVELFTTELVALDDSYLNMLTQVGMQLARVYERQRAAEDMRASEFRYRTIVKLVSDYAYSFHFDSHGRPVPEWGSQAVSTITGYTADELYARGGMQSIVHPDHRSAFDQGGWALLSGQAFNSEYRIITKGGETRWLYDTAEPQHDVVQGRIVRVIGAVRDITAEKNAQQLMQSLNQQLEQQIVERTAQLEAINHVLSDEIEQRKKLEASLQESLRWAEIISNAVPDILFVWDCTNRRLVYTNTSVERILGYPLTGVDHIANEFLGSIRHPDDFTDSAHYIQELDALADGQILERCYRLKRADGEWRWMSDRSLIFRRHADGSPERILSIVRDITETKHAEEKQERLEAEVEHERQRLTRIVATVPGIVWEEIGAPGNPTQQTTFVNNYMEEMLGYTLDEWLATPNFWLSMVHPEDRPQALRNAQAHFSSGKGGSQEFRWVAKDGHIVWAESRASVMTDESGAPRGMRGVTFDITARKKAEVALLQSAERLAILQEIDQLILELRSPAEIADLALRRLHELIPYERASIVLFDLETQSASILAVVAKSPTHLQAGMTFSTVGLHGVAVIQRDEPYVVEDFQAIPNPSSIVQKLVDEGIRSSASVPLKTPNQLFGAFNVHSAIPHAFQPAHAELLREIAGHLGVAIKNNQLIDQVRAGRQRLKVVTQQLMEVQETERRHLAHELHDEIGQTLTAVKINLQALRETVPEDVTQQLDESVSIIEQSLQQVRTLSLDLRPALLDDLGLVPTLRWYLNRQRQSTNLVIQLDTDPLLSRLSPTIETVCFRLVQEALTNIVRHARAEHVFVTLRLHDHVVSVTVHDDGIGFDVADALQRAAEGASLGLLGMQERIMLVGGNVKIESAPGHATTITAHIPTTPTSYLDRRKGKEER